MKKKTILLFSVETGIAHVTRTLEIGRVLASRGHRVIFAIEKSKHEFARNTGVECVPASRSLEEGLSMESINNWKNVAWMLEMAKSDLAIIKQHKPDIIVVDFRPSAVAASMSLGLPTFFVTGSGGLPSGCYLPNPGLPSPLHALATPLLRWQVWRVKKPFFRAMHAASISLGASGSLDDLFHRLSYIVPEYEGYLPANDSSLRINYVDPIFWSGFEKKSPDWLETIKPNGRTIYLSFGGTGYDSKKLIGLSLLLVKSGYQVVVSAANIAPVHDFPKTKNLFVTKYLPGQEVCRHVDLVVCHGGYGTMMQAFLADTPVIAVPFNPDQLLHALRIAELGFGRCIVRYNVRPFLSPEWGSFMSFGSRVPNDWMLKAVEGVLANKKTYQEAIGKFFSGKSINNGALAAARVVESL